MPKTIGPNIKTRQQLPDQMERGQINILECPLTKDGASLTPTSATVVVTDASGTVQSSGAATITAGVPTYTWTPASTLVLGDGWSVVWSITTPADGVVVIRNAAMLCRTRLQCPITVDDIYRVYPGLDPSGSNPLTAQTDTQIDDIVSEAWIQVQSRLLGLGKRPYLVTGAYALREAVQNLSLSLIFAAAAPSSSQDWQSVADRYRVQYEEQWKVLKLDYDQNDDAVTDANAGKVSAKPGVIWLGAAR